MSSSGGRARVSLWEGGWYDPPETQLHVIVSASLLILTYLVARRILKTGHTRGWFISATVVFSLGVAREVWNHWEGVSLSLSHKFFSMWDMVWNVVGVIVGLVTIGIAGRLRR